MPELGGGAQARGGRRGRGPVVGAGRGQDGGPGGQRRLTVGYLEANEDTDQG